MKRRLGIEMFTLAAAVATCGAISAQADDVEISTFARSKWIYNPDPPVTKMIWHGDGNEEMFSLSWDGGVAKFQGKHVDAAARRFFELLVKKDMQPYLDERCGQKHPRTDDSMDAIAEEAAKQTDKEVGPP